MKNSYSLSMIALTFVSFCAQAASDIESSQVSQFAHAKSTILENFKPESSFETKISEELKYNIACQRINLNIFGLLSKGKEEEALPLIILLAESGDLTWKTYYACALYEGRAGLTQDSAYARVLYDEIKSDPFFHDDENEPNNLMKECLLFLEEHFSSK